jgi:hypothetical protein
VKRATLSRAAIAEVRKVLAGGVSSPLRAIMVVGGMTLVLLSFLGCASAPSSPPRPVNVQPAGTFSLIWDEGLRDPFARFDIVLLGYVESMSDYSRDTSGDTTGIWMQIVCRVVRVYRGEWKDRELVFVAHRSESAQSGGGSGKGWDSPSPLMQGVFLVFGLTLKGTTPEIRCVDRRDSSHVQRGFGKQLGTAPGRVLDAIDAHARKTGVKVDGGKIGPCEDDAESYFVELMPESGRTQIVTVDKKTFEVRFVTVSYPVSWAHPGQR